LLGVFDRTRNDARDPVRTRRGVLGPASEFQQLPALGPATGVPQSDRSAKAETAGVIRTTGVEGQR